MTEPSYPIVDVAPDARIGDEPMGTKRKFWWENDRGERWLLKYARPGTGEHWSEKIAAELGTLLVTQLRGVSKHTVIAVLDALEGVEPPAAPTADLASAADWFVGYLLLDAVIANGDRHHENWGVLQASKGARRLAPSYDHATSMGRELKDDERLTRLHGGDRRRTVATYLRRARSAFFEDEHAKRPLHPLDAFRVAGALRPRAHAVWLARLAGVGDDRIEGSLNAFPTP